MEQAIKSAQIRCLLGYANKCHVGQNKMVLVRLAPTTSIAQLYARASFFEYNSCHCARAIKLQRINKQ